MWLLQFYGCILVFGQTRGRVLGQSAPGTVRARKVGHEFINPFVSKRNKSDLLRLCSRAWRAFAVHWHTWRTLQKGVGLDPDSRLARFPPEARTTTRFYHTRGAIINRLTVIDKKVGLSNEVMDHRGDSYERTDLDAASASLRWLWERVGLKSTGEMREKCHLDIV